MGGTRDLGELWNVIRDVRRLLSLINIMSGWHISANQVPIKTLTWILKVKTFRDYSSFIMVEKPVTGSIDLALSWEL